MRAGLLKHRIDLQSNSETVDALGGVVSGWSNYATSVPATVTPLRGVERDGSGQIETQTTYKITIRCLASVENVSPKYRVQYDGRTFDIKSVVDVQERHRMIELMCVEHG